MKRAILFSIFLLSLADAIADVRVLTSVAEAISLSDDAFEKPLGFDFTGNILSDGRKSWIFRDASGGIGIYKPMAGAPALPVGGMARICGSVSVSKDGSRTFAAETARLLSAGSPPEASDATGADILSGRMDYRHVRIQGVLSSLVKDEVDPSCLWAELRTPTGKVFLTFLDAEKDLSRLRDLVDADICVTGLATPISGLRSALGRHVNVSTIDNVVLVSPRTKTPFSASALSSAPSLHRQRASGKVVAVGRGRFYLKSNANRIVPVIPTGEAPMPDPGSHVTVVGFAEADPYRLQLLEALVRQDPHIVEPVDVPEHRTIRSLFVDEEGRNKFDMRSNGVLLTLRGTSTRAESDMLLLSSGTFSVFVDLSCIRNRLEEIPADGSVVEATGLCLAEFESQLQPGIYPTFRRFTLYPRTEADITIIAHPPWWTPIRLLSVIAALGAVILVILIWMRAIFVVSERRGRELYEERIDHALAEQKVEERTRLAVELHDSVSQTLTGVALQLDGGEVETAKTMLASCRGELRRCLWDLRSRTFEEKDMTEAVSRTITPHLNGCQATVRFNVPRERLSESLTHAILRIIRELVVNAIRHGQAKHVKIAGEMHENTVSFSVTDDGQGFVPETAPGPEQGHFGLLGIRERIEDFNGSLKIASAPNLGAKFTVTLTAPDETNEQNKDTDR